MTNTTRKQAKKKLKLKKFAITNLTLNSQEIKNVVGGNTEVNSSRMIDVSTDCTIRPTTGTTIIVDTLTFI